MVAVSSHSAWELVGSVCVSVPNHIVIRPLQTAVGQVVVVLAAAIPRDAQCVGRGLTFFRRRYEQQVVGTRFLSHFVLGAVAKLQQHRDQQYLHHRGRTQID